MSAAGPPAARRHTHPHDPNPIPPSGDPAFALVFDGRSRTINLPTLHSLPQTEIYGCTIVSTGHGTSGPFCFGGVLLRDLLEWAEIPISEDDVINLRSADGFGALLFLADLTAAPAERGPLLATRIDGAPLSRAQGLVRLIVPGEVDDALLQVKWLSIVTVAPSSSR